MSARPAEAAGRVRAAKCDEELRQLSGEGRRIIDVPGSRRLTDEPAVDGPRARELFCRLSGGDRGRDRQGKLRGEPGQPELLLRHSGNVPVVAGQSHAEAVAEAECAVVPAAGFDLGQRKIGPLGKLRSEQPSDQLGRELRAFGPRGHASSLQKSGKSSDVLADRSEDARAEVSLILHLCEPAPRPRSLKVKRNRHARTEIAATMDH